MVNTEVTVFSFGGGQDSFAILYKIVYDKDFRDKYVSGRLVVVMAEKQDQSEHKEMYGCAAMIFALCFGIAIIIWVCKH